MEANASIATGGNRVHVVFGGRVIATIPVKVESAFADSAELGVALHLLHVGERRAERSVDASSTRSTWATRFPSSPASSATTRIRRLLLPHEDELEARL
jgi:hypothetical protein